MSVAISLGGDGNVAGNGATAKAEIGDGGGTASGAATVTTYGDFANGVMVQSIGGGGGNAGFGSSTTEAIGSTRTLGISLAIGAKGGAGGAGGAADVTLYPQGRITTYGSGAIGILAQSIGGGGGASQGGSVNLTGGVRVTDVGGSPLGADIDGSITVNYGVGGAGGGNGGAVTVNVQGAITTAGGDATGVLAQSIGGSGGLGGSTGNEASADNPVSFFLGFRQAASSIIFKDVPIPVDFTVNIGGTGGTGGTGSPVSVTHSGSIVTAGDWAGGIVAQSIGGGGGKAGTAATEGTRPELAISYDIGGKSGAIGNASGTSVTLAGGSLVQTGSSTTGYGAFGVVVQSISGGGGIGADGSDASQGTIKVGGNATSGNFSSSASLIGSGSGVATVSTLGYGAVGVLLQSIGGGGGIGAAGSSVSATAPQPGTTFLQVGGVNALGQGGQVNVSNATLAISTQGANAFGLLAQSIGGGGGLAFAP